MNTETIEGIPWPFEKDMHAVVADLGMMIRRLVHQLRGFDPDSGVIRDAYSLLEKHGLAGSPVRQPKESPAPELPAQASGQSAALTFDDAVRIARGCTDYGGGYRGLPELFEAYQAGISTVVTALTAARNEGMADSQVRALHSMGAQPDAATSDEIEGLRAHVAQLKFALAQAERENDELRAQPAASAEPSDEEILRVADEVHQTGWDFDDVPDGLLIAFARALLSRYGQAPAADGDALREAVKIAYGYLWHVNTEPGTPNQYAPERAAYKARIVLREQLTKDERGEGINVVRAAMQRTNN